MDTRALRLLARGAATMAAFGALAAPATADAASKPLKKKQPKVTSVTPLSANVGDTLKLRGKYFRLGKGKNSVVFKRANSPAIFVKADISTKKVMSVVLPKRLEDYMAVADGVKQPTKFRIRVLARRLGKKYTKLSKSPTIGPEVAKGTDPDPVGPPAADGDCDGDKILNGADDDDDNDLLPDGLENDPLKTDQCKSDTDGDGIGDGYEYQSAVDLNEGEYVPCPTDPDLPCAEPYPNPLDESDANVDFDGDGLTLGEEWDLWVYVGNRTLTPLSYSDGKQFSIDQPAATDPKHKAFVDWANAAGYGTVDLNDYSAWAAQTACSADCSLFDMNRDGTVSPWFTDLSEDDPEYDLPVPSAQDPGPGIQDLYLYSESLYYDTDGDKRLKDGERDEDADGLTNWDELHSRMTRGYWDGCYADEFRYPRPMGDVSHVDSDSDGDGVLDGADDQDNDDVPNVMELSRNAASGLWDATGQCTAVEDLPEPKIGHHKNAYGWVHPYDPCLPDPNSRTCSHNYSFDAIPNPFNADVLKWVALN